MKNYNDTDQKILSKTFTVDYDPEISSEYASSRVISVDSMDVHSQAENFDLRGYEVLPSLCAALHDYFVARDVIDSGNKVIAYRQVSGSVELYATCSVDYVQVNVYYIDSDNRIQMVEIVGALSELMSELV